MIGMDNFSLNLSSLVISLPAHRILHDNVLVPLSQKPNLPTRKKFVRLVGIRQVTDRFRWLEAVVPSGQNPKENLFNGRCGGDFALEARVEPNQIIFSLLLSQQKFAIPYSDRCSEKD